VDHGFVITKYIQGDVKLCQGEAIKDYLIILYVFSLYFWALKKGFAAECAEALEEFAVECANHLQLGAQVEEIISIERSILIKKKCWRSLVYLYS